MLRALPSLPMRGSTARLLAVRLRAFRTVKSLTPISAAMERSDLHGFCRDRFGRALTRGDVGAPHPPNRFLRRSMTNIEVGRLSLAV